MQPRGSRAKRMEEQQSVRSSIVKLVLAQMEHVSSVALARNSYATNIKCIPSMGGWICAPCPQCFKCPPPCVPATSAAVERVFPYAGNIISDERGRLDPTFASQLIFLRITRKAIEEYDTKDEGKRTSTSKVIHCVCNVYLFVIFIIFLISHLFLT